MFNYSTSGCHLVAISEILFLSIIIKACKTLKKKLKTQKRKYAMP